MPFSADFLLLPRYCVIFDASCAMPPNGTINHSPSPFRNSIRMTLRAYAKINIGLRILGKRPDGYHDIETVFHQIDLFDEIVLEPAASVMFATDSADIPTDATNLCVRAARLLKQHTGCSNGVAIRLTKRIPIGAGLGGGSSDAASVLVGANGIWGLGLATSDLRHLAAQVGSDVAFFVEGGTAVGTSRGEVLKYVDLHVPFWIVTATPDIHISTAWAYSNVRLSGSSAAESLWSVVESGFRDPNRLAESVTNGFQDLVFETFPQIGQLREHLLKDGACFSQLSGSGSSVFGLFETESDAVNALRRLSAHAVTSLTAPRFRPERLS